MTREDYIKNLQSMIHDAEDMRLYDEDVESLQVAIKALEQENVIDKIQEEIEHFKNTDYQRNRRTYDKCLEIINKYRGEEE